MGRPYAVFDIDGTIIRWQLYHAINDQLVKDGLIDPGAFAKVRDTRMNWKRRTGTDSFNEYEHELIKVFDKALAGMSVNGFSKAVDAVFAEYRDQVYTYTRDMIRDLQQEGYLLFAISGSPGLIVKKLADHYGFDDFAATTYEQKDSRFTGKKYLSIGRKPELLRELVTRNEAVAKGSIAVGDSEGDIDMLASVERPVAFNPNRPLFEHAKAHGWEIVVERKNVIYRLESHNGSYRLEL